MQNEELLTVEAGGRYSYHWAEGLKDYRDRDKIVQ
jgi:hypothetical protein